jgi:hypothetical protein
MSKTQEKRAQRLAESKAFVKERRMQQFSFFEANLEVGKQLLEANREKLTPEELDLLEKEYDSSKETLEKLREEWEL